MKKNLFFLSLVLGIIIYSYDKEEISINKETGAETAIVINETFLAVTVDDVQFTVDQFPGFGKGYIKSGEIVDETKKPVLAGFFYVKSLPRLSNLL